MNYNDQNTVNNFISSLLTRPGHWASLTESTLSGAYRLGNDARDMILSIKQACETQRGRKGSRLELQDLSEVLSTLNSGYGAASYAAKELSRPLAEKLEQASRTTRGHNDVCPTCRRPR